MFVLQVGAEWTQQINRLRDTLTDDSNFIRRDNRFFRLCRNSGRTVEVALRTSRLTPAADLVLSIQESDFYIHRMGGQLVFNNGQYPKGGILEGLTPTMLSLDGAIQAVKKDPTSGALLKDRTLIAFCVAESLRSDTVAMSIDFMQKQSTSKVLGLDPAAEMVRLVRFAQNWGQASDTIRDALSDKGYEIALKPRGLMNLEERRYSERVDWSRIDARVEDVAGGVKALKLPKPGTSARAGKSGKR